MDGLIEIPADAWVRGGTPDDSRIVPWGVKSIARDDIGYWQGRIERRLVTEAADSLVSYVRQ